VQRRVRIVKIKVGGDDPTLSQSNNGGKKLGTPRIWRGQFLTQFDYQIKGHGRKKGLGVEGAGESKVMAWDPEKVERQRRSVRSNLKVSQIFLM